MIHLVTYDLRKPGQDYTAVHESIKSCGGWWHYLESTWLVDTEMNVEQMAKRVRQHIDQNDRLMIIGVTAQYDGWLPKDAWEWINSRTHQMA